MCLQDFSKFYTNTLFASFVDASCLVCKQLKCHKQQRKQSPTLASLRTNILGSNPTSQRNFCGNGKLCTMVYVFVSLNFKCEEKTDPLIAYSRNICCIITTYRYHIPLRNVFKIILIYTFKKFVSKIAKRIHSSVYTHQCIL